MKTISLKTFSKYENQYIALSKDKTKILSSGKTIREVGKRLEKMKIKEAIIDFIPPLDVSFSI